MLIRTTLTHCAAVLALIVTVIFTSNAGKLLSSPLNFIIVVLAILTALGLAILDVRIVAANRPKRFIGKNRDAKIRKFMTKLVSGDGRYVMSSNDLSWAHGKALEALESKAQAGSLELIMPTETALSRKLVDAGATGHYYGDDNFRFRSRFTIVNAGRAGAWVAVGIGEEEAHVVRSISSNEDPVFHMAADLVALAERAARATS